jgi:hypothetical protein
LVFLISPCVLNERLVLAEMCAVAGMHVEAEAYTASATPELLTVRLTVTGTIKLHQLAPSFTSLAALAVPRSLILGIPRTQAVFGATDARKCEQYHNLRKLTSLSSAGIRHLCEEFKAEHASFGC